MKRLAVGLCATAALCAPATASAQELTLAPYAQGDWTNPYYVDSPPADPHRVMVVEGPGTIWLVKDGTRLPTPFADLTEEVLALGEEGCGGCGLFSIAFAPDYAQTGLFYIAYTEDDTPEVDGHFTIRVDEMRRSASDPDVADPDYLRRVFELPYPDLHYGGQVAFGPDGYLYFSTGDGHDRTTVTDLTQPWGKLMRIDPRGSADGEYTPAPGNPFADGPGGNLDEIWAYGFRNLWRFSFDRATGDLVLADVQEDDWEEMHFLPEGGGAGDFFGWPCFEGSHPFPGAPPACAAPPAHRPPTLEYSHKPGQSSALTGGYVIRDPSLPSLHGRYIYSDSGHGLDGGVRTVVLSEGGASGDADANLGTYDVLSSFGEDACGHIYSMDLVVDVVRRLEPVNGQLTCKLGPTASIDAAAADRAAKRRAVVLGVTCDEDCELAATGFVRVKRGKGKGRRPFSIAAAPAAARVQMGQEATVRLELTKKAARRLRRAIRAGRKAVAGYSVSTTGWNGGTGSVSGRAGVKG